MGHSRIPAYRNSADGIFVMKSCHWCGKKFLAMRTNKKYCRHLHQQLAWRHKVRYQSRRDQERPWYKVYRNIWTRVNNPKHHGYEYYCHDVSVLTIAELEKLWLRDKASMMRRPSIDRIKSTLGYTYGNCRFIELAENARKSVRRRVKLCGR